MGSIAALSRTVAHRVTFRAGTARHAGAVPGVHAEERCSTKPMHPIAKIVRELRIMLDHMAGGFATAVAHVMRHLLVVERTSFS